MKFNKLRFYKTPLQLAVEYENLEIVQLLLTSPTIDPNIKSISNIIIFLIQFL